MTMNAKTSTASAARASMHINADGVIPAIYDDALAHVGATEKLLQDMQKCTSDKQKAACERSLLVARIAHGVVKTSKGLDAGQVYREAIRILDLKTFKDGGGDDCRTKKEQDLYGAARTYKSRAMALLKIKPVSNVGGAGRGQGRKGKASEEANTEHVETTKPTTTNEAPKPEQALVQQPAFRAAPAKRTERAIALWYLEFDVSAGRVLKENEKAIKDPDFIECIKQQHDISERIRNILERLANS
jgi:hypothetical protein